MISFIAAVIEILEYYKYFKNYKLRKEAHEAANRLVKCYKDNPHLFNQPPSNQ